MLHWYSEMEKKRYWDLLKNSLEIMHFDNQVLMIIEKEKMVSLSSLDILEIFVNIFENIWNDKIG